jgi:hypothetical protein
MGTGVLLPGDPHLAEVEAAEAAFAGAEARLASDPIGAEADIQLAREAVGRASRPPQPTPGRPWGPGATSVFDELASVADGLRSAVARLRVFDLLGAFARFWLLVWVGCLLLVVFTSVLPLALLAFGLFLVLVHGGGLFRAVLSLLGLGAGAGGRRS